MPPADAAGEQVAFTRRAFLTACSGLVLAAAGCARLGPAARAGYALLNDPPLEAYGEVLDGLIAAVLPLEDASFPLPAGRVRTRVLDLFRLDRDPRLVTVEKALVLFDDVDLFAQAAPLRGAERALLQGTEAGGVPESLLEQREEEDRARFTAFAAATPSRSAFRALNLDRKRAYLRLWAGSAFILRRQFHASARALVLIAAYSAPELWPAIGYDGPLVPAAGSQES